MIAACVLFFCALIFAAFGTSEMPGWWAASGVLVVLGLLRLVLLYVRPDL